MSGKQLRILSVVAVLLLGSFLVWRYTADQMAAPEMADDALGQGIIDRWEAGLPAGYTAETADDLDRGHLYAVLTYADGAGDVLTGAWEAAGPEAAAAFQTMTAAHAALPDLDAAHAQLLAAAPTPGDGWLGAHLTDGDAEIVLLYDPDGGVLYLAERQPV